VAPQFVDLTADKDALSAMLRRLNMIERDEVPSVSPLTGGVSSNIVRVDTKLGSFCLKQALPMLKVEKEWLAPVERVFVEIAWLRTAAAIAPRNIPRIIAVDNGTGSFLMEFLPPDGYTSWKASLLAGEVKPGIGAQLGFVLNLIHSRTAGNPEVIAEFDNPFNHENFMAIRLDSYLLETGRQYPDRVEFFSALVASLNTNKRALVHGDISPKNILIGPDGPVILDAECACYGDPAFDVAFLLNHLLLKSAYRPEKSAAYSSEFAGFKSAYFTDISWEPAAELEKRVATLLPALLLARVDGKSPVEYLSEPQRDRVRTLALRLLDEENEALNQLQSAWYSEINK
jgi:aminoglycoside phosphotransferase (APT) family kinase protein